MVRRLIELLEKREEMIGLVAYEYDELYALLVEEAQETKETLDFYEKRRKSV
jgi:hypothetical protein